MRHRHLLALATSAVLLTAGCAGASDDGGERSAEKKPSAAAESSSSGTSPELAATVRAAVEATGRTSARLTHKSEVGDSTTMYTIAGSGDFDLANDRGNLTVDLATTRFEEVFADGKVYVRGTAGGRRGGWTATGRDQTEARYLLRPPANDPEFVLRQVSMVKEYGKVAEEDLNGVRTVHYRGLLPDEAVTLRMAKETLDKTATMRTAFGGRIPALADVWVDPQGRAVQARVGLEVKDLPKMVTTVGFTELGKTVQVTPPAGAETTPADGFGSPALG